MFETLTVEAEGSLGHLTLNRPQKLNPLSTETLVEIARAAAWFDEQPEVKVVIVRGAGRGGSAGGVRGMGGGARRHARRPGGGVGAR